MMGHYCEAEDLGEHFANIDHLFPYKVRYNFSKISGMLKDEGSVFNNDVRYLEAFAAKFQDMFGDDVCHDWRRFYLYFQNERDAIVFKLLVG